MQRLVLLLGLVLLAGCQSSGSTARPTAPPAMLAAPLAGVKPPVIVPAPTPGLLVTPVRGLGLFEDEAGLAEAQIAAWARKQGMVVIPARRSHELLDRARRGLDPAGKACGIPLGNYAARQRYRAELNAKGMIKSYVGCHHKTGRCHLTVRVSDALDWSGKTVGRYRAEFSRDTHPTEALKAAINALAPYEDKGGAGGISGAVGSSRKVTAQPERLSFSAHSPLPIEGTVDDKEKFRRALSLEDDNALRACFGDTSGSASLLVLVNETGRVVRCEPKGVVKQEDTCACKVFLAHASGAPPIRGARAKVYVNRRAADVVTPSNIVVTAWMRTHNQRYKNRDGKTRWRPAVSDRSIEDYRPPAAHGLTRCFATREAPGKISMVVDIPFDDVGRATGSRMFKIIKGKLTADESTCVLAYLKKTRAPCPAKVGTVARLGVNVKLQKLGAKRGDPVKDVLKKQ